MPRTYCGQCRHETNTNKEMRQHYSQAHNLTILPPIKDRVARRVELGLPPIPPRKYTRKETPPEQPASDTPALDAIRGAEQAIRKAVHELEGERDKVQNKLRELDNAINKYRKMVQ